jgi:hypothetical protein
MARPSTFVLSALASLNQQNGGNVNEEKGNNHKHNRATLAASSLIPAISHT